MREGRIGRLGLANVNCYTGWIDNKIILYSTGTYIQYPLINHYGKNMKKKIYIYIYVCYIYICVCYIYICVCYIYIYIYITYIYNNWATLLYSRNLHNIVNQLHFNQLKKIKFELTQMHWLWVSADVAGRKPILTPCWKRFLCLAFHCFCYYKQT